MKHNSHKGFSKDVRSLEAKAAAMREEILRISHRAKIPHIGSCLSLVEIFTVLYSRILNIPPARGKEFAKRDRVVLSKGHAGLALYVALREKGLLPARLLAKYLEDGTTLAGHPVGDPARGIEVTTGSLGHGFPMAVGLALAAKRDQKRHRVFAIVSDGECDEGSTWEAVLMAAQWELDNLTVIVDHNKIQGFGRVNEVMDLKPFAEKWRSFRWGVKEVDGHDMPALEKALSGVPFKKGFPSVVIAHTFLGKGVSFMEDTLDWHYKNLTDAMLEQAVGEIRNSLADSAAERNN